MSKDNLKPKLVVSRCLGFEACRWNGVTIPSEIVKTLSPHSDMITVCPEVEIGLGVPRDPIRVIRKQKKTILFQPATQRDITQSMKDYIHDFLTSLGPVDGFVLKSKSPTCGIVDVKIYPGPGKVAVASKGEGFLGGAAKKLFPNVAIEDEARLTNYRIRDHFLTKLFLLARFRQMELQPTAHKLVQFHAQHKLIYMAYNQKLLRILGRITANQDQLPLLDQLYHYKSNLQEIFSKMPRYTSHINVLQHALGYVSKRIKSDERHYFLNSLEDYRQNRLPLSALLTIMKSWIIRFEVKYLQDQFYFNPYPLQLVQITDSGKGRTLKS